MVFFALTRRGYNDYKALDTPSILCLLAGALADSELSLLRAEGRPVTDFNHKMDPHDSGLIADAMATIREHHPEQTIWVEGPGSP